MSVTIRTIRQEDNAAIASLIRTVFREFGVDRPGTVYTDPTTDHLFELFQTPGAIYFIAEQNNEMLGGCGIFPTEGLPEGYAELVKFYLSAAARGKGTGHLLMNTCVEAARSAGYTHLYLESLPELNKAISLYVKNGFTDLSQPLGNSGHFGCTLWMVKKL